MALGEVEKNWVKRLVLEGALTAMPLFPGVEGEDEGLEGSLTGGVFENRRGIARKRLTQGEQGHSTTKVHGKSTLSRFPGSKHGVVALQA